MAKIFWCKGVNSGRNYSQKVLLTGNKAALTSLNQKNSGVNGAEPEKKAALTGLNRKNSGVNGVEPEE